MITTIISATMMIALFVCAVAGFWDMATQKYFTDYQGKIKRGISLWRDTFTPTERRFLEGIQRLEEVDRGFIRSHNREILITEKRRWTGRNSWPYVGYVDLSSPENKLEYRAPWSSFIMWAAGFLALSILILSETFAEQPVLAIGLAVVFIGGATFIHYRERKRILSILKRAMQRDGV